MATPVLQSDLVDRFARIKLAGGTQTDALLNALEVFGKESGDANAYGWSSLTDNETNHPGKFDAPYQIQGIAVAVYPMDPASADGPSDVAKVLQHLGLQFKAHKNSEEHPLGPLYAFPPPRYISGADMNAHMTGATSAVSFVQSMGPPVFFKTPIDCTEGQSPRLKLTLGSTPVATVGDLIVDFWILGDGYKRTATA